MKKTMEIDHQQSTFGQNSTASILNTSKNPKAVKTIRDIQENNDY